MHRKLAVGSVIQMNVGNMNMVPPGVAVPGLPREFERFATTTVYRLGRPVAGTPPHPDYEPIKVGPSTNPERSFLWLPYIPGAITLMAFDRSKTICTGWMSGCWLVHCTINGAAHFAHIGTSNNAHDPATVKVKNAFKLAVGTGALRVVRAFQSMCRTAEETMGAMSTHGNFYTIGISKVASNLPKAQARTGVNVATIQISGPVGGSFSNLQVMAKTREVGVTSLPYAF